MTSTKKINPGKKRSFIWEYYTDAHSNSTMNRASCNYCQYEIVGNSARMTKHSLACKEIPDELKENLLKIIENKNSKDVKQGHRNNRIDNTEFKKRKLTAALTIPHEQIMSSDTVQLLRTIQQENRDNRKRIEVVQFEFSAFRDQTQQDLFQIREQLNLLTSSILNSKNINHTV